MKRRTIAEACRRRRLPSPRCCCGRRPRAQTVLKFSHTDQPGGARQKAAELFAQKVEQYTQGRYKVQVYPAGQLANDPKGVEQLQLGGIDFTVTGTGTYATHIPTLNLTALPFLVETLPAGLEAVRRVEVAAGAVRQGAGEGLPLPVDRWRRASAA